MDGQHAEQNVIGTVLSGATLPPTTEGTSASSFAAPAFWMAVAKEQFTSSTGASEYRVVIKWNICFYSSLRDCKVNNPEGML